MSYHRPYATYSPYSAEVEAEAAKHGMAERAAEVDADAEVHENGEGQMATDKFYSSYKSVFPSITSSVFQHSIFPYYTYP
jgi:hypothetical protein